MADKTFDTRRRQLLQSGAVTLAAVGFGGLAQARGRRPAATDETQPLYVGSQLSSVSDISIVNVAAGTSIDDILAYVEETTAFLKRQSGFRFRQLSQSLMDTIWVSYTVWDDPEGSSMENMKYRHMDDSSLGRFGTLLFEGSARNFRDIGSSAADSIALGSEITVFRFKRGVSAQSAVTAIDNSSDYMQPQRGFISRQVAIDRHGSWFSYLNFTDTTALDELNIAFGVPPRGSLTDINSVLLLRHMLVRFNDRDGIIPVNFGAACKA